MATAHTVKWGIIGCGNVTEVKSGPAFNKVANSSLVAVMRRDGAKAADYAQRHGIAKWYDDAYQLINDPEVNAVYIATPPSSHEEYTLAALAAGKPVYVEKPMALSEASCLKMAEASQTRNTKLSVAHYRRQLPVFKKIKALLAAKVIGDIRFVNISLFQSEVKNMIAKTEENWRVNPAIAGGGLFHDLAPHQLDLMYHFFGRAHTVTGIARNQASSYAADDIVSGQMLFDNGVVLSGLWCFTVAEDEVKDVCEIIGSEGKISFAFFGSDIEVSKNGQIDSYHLPYPPHVQQPMIEEVVKYFLETAPNPCPAEEAAVVMRWMDMMTKKVS
jgi:predicted dehydrogenase